jgi:hypothetical protein
MAAGNVLCSPATTSAHRTTLGVRYYLISLTLCYNKKHKYYIPPHNDLHLFLNIQHAVNKYLYLVFIELLFLYKFKSYYTHITRLIYKHPMGPPGLFLMVPSNVSTLLETLGHSP